jgi:hypothetical protein
LINDIALRAMLLPFQLHALPEVLPQLPANSRCFCWQLIVVVLVQSDSDISGISLMVLRQRFFVFFSWWYGATRVAGDVVVFSCDINSCCSVFTIFGAIEEFCLLWCRIYLTACLWLCYDLFSGLGIPSASRFCAIL